MNHRGHAALNAVCPYFTMFPLEFPLRILRRHARPGQWVMDPFCGRGTTNYAARTLGLPSVGIDSSPVAVALTQAKLANATPRSILAAARRILDEVEEPLDLPEGEFWNWAFHRKTLEKLCRLRHGLMQNCRSDARKALRAILLGALHGPGRKSSPSHLSNQAPRTYAPKPRYAVKFWKDRGLTPEPVDVLSIVAERAWRYYPPEEKRAAGTVVMGDSRRISVHKRATRGNEIEWVITSPPYYGMRTYIPDQWLRRWFLGGSSEVDYSAQGQMSHTSPNVFASQLEQVWHGVGAICAPGAVMVVRFGGINDRKADPLLILEQSLEGTGWATEKIESAGSASEGQRQALHFSAAKASAREEYDLWAVWRG